MSAALPVQSPLRRLADWQLRLAALVAERAAQPFAWGSRDCCTWAADAVLAVTGADVAADLRGRYGSARQATRLLARLGGLQGLCEQRLGAEVPPAAAQPGDVGRFAEPARAEARRWGLAVHTGAAWLAQGAAGLVPVQPERVALVWRCCHG